MLKIGKETLLQKPECSGDPGGREALLPGPAGAGKGWGALVWGTEGEGKLGSQAVWGLSNLGFTSHKLLNFGQVV